MAFPIGQAVLFVVGYRYSKSDKGYIQSVRIQVGKAVGPQKNQASNPVALRALPPVTFGHTSQSLAQEVDRLSPPSRTMAIQAPSGRTIQLRRWWQPERHEPFIGTQAPVILMIHGLSGRSAWMAPLVDEMMKSNVPKNAQFYGIDLPMVGQNPTGEGYIDNMDDLIGSVRDAIDILAKRHQGPVYAVGLSLGGLLLGSVAGENPPEALKGMALLSPACKPNQEKAKPKAILQAASGWIQKKMGKSKADSVGFLSRKVSLPSSKQFTPLQKAILRHKDRSKSRVRQLSFDSYLKMFAAMWRFRTQLANQVTLPVKVYGTRTDDLVDQHAIQTSFARFASPYKEMKIFPRALHDLVMDPLNPRIASDISRFFADLDPGSHT